MGELKCSRPGCTASIMNHKWGRIKASPEWLFMKSGNCYCPDHWPDWARKWREEKIQRETQARLEAERKTQQRTDNG